MSLVLTLAHQRGANFVQINIYDMDSILCDVNSIETGHIVTWLGLALSHDDYCVVVFVCLLHLFHLLNKL